LRFVHFAARLLAIMLLTLQKLALQIYLEEADLKKDEAEVAQLERRTRQERDRFVG
jgi:hypothetical protein